MKNLLVLLSGMALIGSQALASGTSCSSYDGNVTYSYHQPEGGAFMPSTQKWVINGVEYFDSLELPVVPSVVMEVELGSNVTLNESVEGFYNVTTYANYTRALDPYDDNKELFGGYMLCKNFRYNGPPRP